MQCERVVELCRVVPGAGAQCPSLFYRPLVSVDFGLRLGCCLRLVCVNLSLDVTLDRHHFMGKF